MTLTTKTYSQTSSSQFQCGFDEFNAALKIQNSDYVNQIQTTERQILHNATTDVSRSTVPYIIPVVFHVLYAPGDETTGDGSNISDAQLQNQLDILNFYFQQLNSNIKFCKAQKKPPDNSDFLGITRNPGPAENNFDNLSQLTDIIYYPQNNYMNIYSKKH